MNSRESRGLGLAMVFLLLITAAQPGFASHSLRHKAAPPATPPVSAMVPVTAHSEQSRALFEKGMNALEGLQVDVALRRWREAAATDSKFALAHLFVAYATTQPEEERHELARARQLANGATPDERLLIAWVAGAREGQYVESISAMNDLLARYPRDARLAFLCGRWLLLQQQYDRSITLMERAGEYPAALNELGYAYAFSGQFDRAYEVLERYSALEPTQPNPHDTYGEVLRMAGKFQRSLWQYRAALKVDPSFYWSQFGMAETYALMNDGERARAEYDKAIAMAPSASEKLDFKIQQALTYVREGDFKQSHAMLERLAAEARNEGLERTQALLNRMLATSTPDYADATEHLDAAEHILLNGHTIANADRDEELARLLRVRVGRAASNGAWETADAALQRLQGMAANSSHESVVRSYQAAQGELLMARGDFAQAIPHLEEDSANCLSARMLLTAYSRTGAAAEAEALQRKLANWNDTSLENALVVPQLRAQRAQAAAQ